MDAVCPVCRGRRAYCFITDAPSSPCPPMPRTVSQVRRQPTIRDEVTEILGGIPRGQRFTSREVLAKVRNRQASLPQVSRFISEHPGVVNTTGPMEVHVWVML